MLIHLPPSSIVTTRIFVVSLVGNIKPQPSLSTGVGMQNHSNHTVFELSAINLGQRPLRHSCEKFEEKQQTVPGLAKFGPKFPNKTLGVLRLMVFLCCGYLVASFPPPQLKKSWAKAQQKSPSNLLHGVSAQESQDPPIVCLESSLGLQLLNLGRGSPDPLIP